MRLENLNLAAAEKLLCETALNEAGSIVEASNLLGITRHALKRRIIKHSIEWPRPRVSQTVQQAQQVVGTIAQVKING